MTIVWFRNDLRLADHPALMAAAKSGEAILPIYIHDPGTCRDWTPGAASNWWLHHSLHSLNEDLEKVGCRLVVLAGPSRDTLLDLVKAVGATSVFWNRRYEPAAVRLDSEIKENLRDSGVDARSFNASLLFEPWVISNKSGRPFQVFTPFWKTCLEQLPGHQPLSSPTRLPPPPPLRVEVSIDDLGLLPTIPWDAEFSTRWQPGEQGAANRLAGFLNGAFDTYPDRRNTPAIDGTSGLSPHLHFGEISPLQIITQIETTSRDQNWKRNSFVTELGWREFAHHLLHHFPHTTDAPLRENFSNFPWNEPDEEFQAWTRGRTGYPLVDAGMRQLWTTGWMHNRVRMVVGSFLVKDLLIDWRHGARWFWDTLVDADLANNTLGWQWVAGCGADAAPFFRIFNPVSQGEKFDSDGAYVRRWVPELKNLPDRFIHRPWEASNSILRDAGVTLGETYPEPIIDHSTARNVALDAYAKIKRT